MNIAEPFTIPAEDQPQFLTRVETLFHEGRCNYRLLFGYPLRTVEKERQGDLFIKKYSYFKPGDLFALDLWERNAYGTTKWAVYVLQAALPGEMAVRVPLVTPATKVLLEAIGKDQAQAALRFLKEIEERTDPTTLCPNRFLLTDFRVKASTRKGRPVFR